MESYKKKYLKYKTKYKNLKEGIMIVQISDDYSIKRAFGNVDVNKIMISNVSQYSLSSEKEALYVAKRIKQMLKTDNLVITDATANVGGNTYGFARTFKLVNAVEIEKEHAKMLENNMKFLGVDDKIKIIEGDYTEIYKNINQDVIYIDAPWGGPSYREKKIVDLELSGINIINFSNELLDKAKLIVYRVPFNFDFNRLNNITRATTIIVDRIFGDPPKINDHQSGGKMPHFMVYIFGNKIINSL